MARKYTPSNWITSADDPDDMGFLLASNSSPSPSSYNGDGFLMWHGQYQDVLLEQGVCSASDATPGQSQSGSVRDFLEWFMSIPFIATSGIIVEFCWDLLGEFVGSNFNSESNSFIQKAYVIIKDYSIWTRAFAAAGYLGKALNQILQALRDVYGMKSLSFLSDSELAELAGSGALRIPQVLAFIAFLAATYLLVKSLIDDGTFNKLGALIEVAVTGSTDDPDMQAILRKLYWNIVDPQHQYHH
jgi:hypothetical protein